MKIPAELRFKSLTITCYSCSLMNNILMRRGLAIAWTIIILIGCTWPGSGVPHEMSTNDKLMHVVIFVPFSALWMLAGRGLLGRPAWVLLAGVLYGALIEIIQASLPIGRNGDVQDVIADSVGVIIGIGLAMVWQRLFQKA